MQLSLAGIQLHKIQSKLVTMKYSTVYITHLMTLSPTLSAVFAMYICPYACMYTPENNTTI